MKVAIIGGGAAGFFLAIQVKTQCPEAQVTILERQHRCLAKVAISGGGRCNCTNSFRAVKDLAQVYPRGAKLLKRLFRVFDHQSMMDWLEGHGVPLVVQEDECVFPVAQDSQVIIDCFLRTCHRLGVEIRTGVDGFAEAFYSQEGLLRSRYDCVAITTGGLKGALLPEWLRQRMTIEAPLPSLFTFRIADPEFCALMGTVVEHAIVSIPSTKWRCEGPLLITHWGMSGPAVLKLSSHAARYLADLQYRSPLSVNWTGEVNAEVVRAALQQVVQQAASRQVLSVRPFNLPRRLWEYLVAKLNLHEDARWSELGRKHLNRMVELLTNDLYQLVARGTHKEEFVTCGGVSLKCVDAHTLELKWERDVQEPRIFLAGEVLDIDGVTGGFNLQAAWTTAYVAAQGICKS